MISIVTCFNDRDILDNFLLKSLHNQTSEFELIALDNTKNIFKSASSALNFGGKKAKGKYIMYVHQDVDLHSNKWLEEVEKCLDDFPNLGIAGVAGKKNTKGVMTTIDHGHPSKLAGKIKIQTPEIVQTLDECLVIIPRKIFNTLQFDEDTCDDWHLYAVDYCLSVKKLGFDVYVIPIYVYHRSDGASFSEMYYCTLEKILLKYKNEYNAIYTTVGDWSTSFPLYIQRLKFWRLGKMAMHYWLRI